MRDALTSLIDAMRDSAVADGTWTIATDRVISLLSVEPAEFYRVLYAVRDRICLSDAIDGFAPDNVGDLVTILECMHGASVETAFREASLFLGHNSRIDLMECFLSVVQEAAGGHSVRRAEFEAMLRTTGDFDEAVSAYLNDSFSLNLLFRRACERFDPGSRNDAVSRRLLRDYLESLFSRHVLSVRAVFGAIARQLWDLAFECGFFDRETNAAEDTAEIADLDRARAAMGLRGKGAGREVLRRRYRELMKLYHPDVNPRGLERCKEINNAYSLLLSVCAG